VLGNSSRIVRADMFEVPSTGVATATRTSYPSQL
jgi:hypothetical protein